jgi:hypothetical protein
VVLWVRMQRLDWLRISLLASLTGCGVGFDDGGSEGNTTTTMGSGPDSTSEGTATSADGTETGDDEVCELGCEGATVLAEGIVQCPDSRINRVGSGSFEPIITASSCEGTETAINCTSDDECNSGPNGKCIHGVSYDDLGETTRCDCAYACATDDDCAEGSFCLAPGVLPGTPDWPICWAAGECATNSDCGECGECGLGAFDDGCGYAHAVSCRTAGDQCGGDDACAEEFGMCFPDSMGTWTCQYPGCAIGRPLLVDAVACTAPPRSRTDWASIPSSSERLREDPELAAYWAEVAALEHASVASFARFGAQLLALGAPPELLRASKQAALDEIEHARLAYGLASAYAGRSIGPGQLDLGGVSTTASWREVVASLIQEACVGETLGVAEAMAAAESARVPAVRRVLERIVADELRHARLAWRSLKWLLREADDADRAWAQALLERSIRAVGASGSNDGLHRPADGVLGAISRRQVHLDASSRVLAPLAQALRPTHSVFAS